MNENANGAEIVVSGVADTRMLPLDRLAAEAAGTAAAEQGKRVLPAEGGRVPVAAFGSSI